MNIFYENNDLVFSCQKNPGFSFPCHMQQQLEFIYVEEGCIQIQIAEQERMLNCGELAIVFPNMIHSYTEPDGTPAVITIGILSLNLTGNFMQKLISSHPAVPYLGADLLHPDVLYAIRRLTEEKENMYAIQALSELFLARVFPCLTLKRNRHSATEDLTYQIASYLTEHFLEQITLTNVAKELGINKYYLSRIFSEKFQIGFQDYINQMRVHYAVDQIRQKKLSLTEIAYQSGFNSQRTFNRAFFKYLHMTPSTYKKTYLQAI